jgi:polar amino acid transport system permease protein
MGNFLTLRRIVLPQAMRAILPGMANQVISLVKGTSIASVIFVNELTFRAQQVVGQNFRFFTVFAAAGLIYLALTSAGAGMQAWLERHFDPETRRDASRRAGLGGLFGIRRVPPAAVEAQPPVVASAATLGGGFALGPTGIDRPAVDPVPFVVCRGVHKSYGPREVLRGIDLTVARGEGRRDHGAERLRKKHSVAAGKPSGTTGRR